MHPWHADIHASSVSDWTLQGPLSASLPSGFVLSFFVNDKTLIVFGTMEGVGEHLLDIQPTSMPQSFAEGLSLLKDTLDIPTALALYHRLQAFLISQDLQGQWSVIIARHALYIAPVLEGTRHVVGQDLSEDFLPVDLRRDLLQRWDHHFPSFESTACATYSEFQCTVPSSSHQRLQILQQHFEAL